MYTVCLLAAHMTRTCEYGEYDKCCGEKSLFTLLFLFLFLFSTGSDSTFRYYSYSPASLYPRAQ